MIIFHINLLIIIFYIINLFFKFEKKKKLFQISISIYYIF